MNDNFNQNGSKNAQNHFLRVGAVISRFFSDDEPKEKFNCKCDFTKTKTDNNPDWL